MYQVLGVLSTQQYTTVFHVGFQTKANAPVRLAYN